MKTKIFQIDGLPNFGLRSRAFDGAQELRYKYEFTANHNYIYCDLRAMICDMWPVTCKLYFSPVLLTSNSGDQRRAERIKFGDLLQQKDRLYRFVYTVRQSPIN